MSRRLRCAFRFARGPSLLLALAWISCGEGAMLADSQAGDVSSGDRCDCESGPADIPDPEECREVAFEDVLDGIDDVGDGDFSQADALGDSKAEREVICPPWENGSCPPEWSPIDGSCLPGDCDYSVWMAGQCVTQLMTIHATGPFLFSPGDSAEDVCGRDHEPMFLNPDFGPGSIVCFDVPRIGAYLGPYFTHDGGTTWLPSHFNIPGYFDSASSAPLLLRSRAIPDLVLLTPIPGIPLMGPLWVSEDAGASFRRIDVGDLIGFMDAAIAPDGHTLFVLTTRGQTPVVIAVDLPSGTLRQEYPLTQTRQRFLGAAWSIRPLSFDEVLVTGRYISTVMPNQDGFRAVVHVNLSEGTEALTGPELSGIAAWALLSVGEPGGPLYLLAYVDKLGQVLYRYHPIDGTWEQRGPVGAPGGKIMVLDRGGDHLLGGPQSNLFGTYLNQWSRSLDGGATWTEVTKVPGDEQLLYFGIVEGDRFCPSDGTSCESWSYAFDTGVLNVQVPSFMWRRTDDTCTYRPATGNLPFIESIPGLGPCNLAPFTVLALGKGRAVVFLGRKMPSHM